MVIYTIIKQSRKWPISVTTTREVYWSLLHFVGHEEAQKAEGWCELASVGEVYYHNSFEIEVEEI